MTISVYKVQTVLNSYLKQLKSDEISKDEDRRRVPKDIVSISGEAKKKHTMDKMGQDAVKNLHKWALEPFEEDEKIEA